MKNKVKKVLQKASAIALVLGMSLSPCITGFGKVFAAEPDTNGDADVTYDVTIEDSEHGKVQFADSALKKLSFKEEDEVTIKTYPDSGYDLEKLSLYSDDGTEICSGTEGDEFSFEMPAADLTVKASFVKDSNDSSSKEPIKYKKDGTAAQKDLDGIDKDLQKYIGKGRRLAENWESMSQGIATISTNQNDTVTINPHDKTQYGSWVTHHFDIVNQDGSTDLGFCVQPNKGTPSGQYQAQVLNNDVIKFILMLYAGDPSGFVLGSHPENYAVCHAILSYVYTGSTKGLNAGDKAAIIDFVEVDLIPGAQQAAKDHATIYGRKWDDYTAYVAINDKQDIVWLSGNPKGDLDLAKSSANEDITNGNDCYSLEGAVYGVYDKNGTEVSRITTDANGQAKAEKLAAGNYTIKEIQAPKGYEKDDTVYSCTVPSGGTVQVKVADNPGNDPAAIEISKIDQETGSLSTQGAASLEGAQFTLTHYGKYYTEEQIKSGEADKDAEENGVAKRTWVVETKEKTFSDKSKHYITGLNDEYKVSGDDFYYTEGNKNATLPLGTLVVEETKAPQGYNLDGAYFTANGSTDKIDGKYVAQITKEGDIVKLNGGNEYSVSDRVIRGDISFTKMDEEEQSRMAGIPFKITSNTTGESHTVVTDENGYFSSASSFNKHSKDTNGGKADSGLWFGLNADGENVKVNDEYGAFPYDTYTIEEQRCDANQDKALYKGTFTVSRDNYQIDLGTIDNPDLTISTTVKDEETNSHYAQACDDVTLIDTVSYTGLKKNKEYTLSGVLVDKETGEPVLDQNGNQVTATTKFKPKTAEGTAEVEFAFDATGFDGKTLVVYEELSLNGEKLAKHKDLNDEGQTIYFPGVGTTALDKDTNDHISKADKEITIVDTVRYTNLRVGKKYTVKGILMDQETGKKVLDADGQEVTASASFTAETKDGTVDITFKFDGSKLAGKTVVAFENVYYKDKLYASHADLSDESQTVQIPKIGTKAADVKTGTDLSFAEKDITITDQVSYENLLIGKTYTVKGTLMDQETGKALEIDGKKITAEKTFVAEQASGSVDLSFTFDGSKLAGKTTVVFEDLTYNNVSVAVHEDLKDEGQTVHIPKIGTTAVSDATGINVNKAEKEVSLTDTVKYENLVKGREYTVTGKLMNQATGEPLLVDGKEVTAEKSFTPDKESGSVDITFKFNADALAGQSVVAFETMTYEDHVIAVHTDINDDGQTVHFPEIKTTALDNASKDHVGFAGKEMTVIDTVKYTNLVKGKEYTVKGVLMDKETGKVVLDKDGNRVTAEKTFTAEKANGSVDLVFTFDSSLLAGKTVVAFEDVYYKGISVGTHADINDEEQSVHLPKIKTTAVDGENGTKNSMADSTVIIKDTVSFENLIPGKEYTMKGVLKDQETGKTVKAKVGTDTSEGFTVPDGAETVNFEKGSYAYVAEGNDTVKPGLYEKTDAGYVLSGTEDTVELDDSLITWSRDFTEAAEGYIQDGKVVIRPAAKYTFSEKEEDVTAEAVFTPEESNGTVELTFVFDGSKMAGKTFVVFEDAYYNDVKVATHSDIEDKDQTVYVPEIHTTARDAESGTQNALASKTVKIIDTVDYKNLIIGKEYTVSGKLYDKATEKPLLVDGKEVTGKTTFTAEKSEGSVEVVFEFDGSALKNQTIVAFEDLYIDGKQVATHSDINDKDQSIYFPEIHTTATDKADGDHQVTAAGKVTITDAVRYENLLSGAKYKVVGTLMDKETGKAVLVNGNEVKAEAEFTAEKESGTVNVDFTFDASKLGGKSVVVFEKLYTAEGKEIANHEDINDEGQTVKLVNPPKPAKGKVQTGDNFRMYGLFAGAAALLVIGSVCVFKKDKKKDKNDGQDQ